MKKLHVASPDKLALAIKELKSMAARAKDLLEGPLAPSPNGIKSQEDLLDEKLRQFEGVVKASSELDPAQQKEISSLRTQVHKLLVALLKRQPKSNLVTYKLNELKKISK